VSVKMRTTTLEAIALNPTEQRYSPERSAMRASRPRSVATQNG
jgi:hypothetical protein